VSSILFSKETELHCNLIGHLVETYLKRKVKALQRVKPKGL